jgi:membrane protease YdiL (CAAX protease family)
MSGAAATPPGFWRIVWLLLAAANKRAAGRRARQRQLYQMRAGKKARDFGAGGFILVALIMVGINVLAGGLLLFAVNLGAHGSIERHGQMLVDRWFLTAVRDAETRATSTPGVDDISHLVPPRSYRAEAVRLAQRGGGDRREIADRLQQIVRDRGSAGLADNAPAMSFSALAQGGRQAGMMGSIVLLLWSAMLVFQGEGLELDIQRRRHPMWEFLFSHPVRGGAVFLAEMLAPIAANPLYLGAPFFCGLVYGFGYGRAAGVAAGVLVGIPVTVAAACLGKALEIGVMLRFPPRSRGAMMGLMSWAGYASMMVLLLSFAVFSGNTKAVEHAPEWMLAVPWPWFGLFIGLRPDGTLSFWHGVVTCTAGAAVVIGGAVGFSVWGAQKGLASPTGTLDPAHRNVGVAARFDRNGLFRKELLWFTRDRGAIVQAVLIPLTAASFQLFNLRNMLARADHAWNYLCGAAILFGTYFLTVLGPKSLASEGAALWLPMTWPLGMEALLKAKARLWAILASVVVALVMGYGLVLFPQDRWKIVLVFVAWYFFARSMADKTVTLATITSESGEVQKVPTGRRWAAQLGMLTFAIGVMSQQWSIAAMGLVFSVMTAAAMWQNFRARLPYLYDPWSEQMPTPPTLMHAMVAISILVELGTVLMVPALLYFGTQNAAVARAAVYGAFAAIVAIGTFWYLEKRGVRAVDILRWRQAAPPGGGQNLAATGRRNWLIAMGAAIVLGVALGGFAHAYVILASQFGPVAEMLRKSQAQMDQIPHMRESLIVMAVFVAPFAEEFLFRGLLYRALDREWGGWRAVLGSAAFFAVYHPALAWVPVGLLGATNALLFRRTGRLEAAVLLHMVYNAVVTL